MRVRVLHVIGPVAAFHTWGLSSVVIAHSGIQGLVSHEGLPHEDMWQIVLQGCA